MWQGLVAALQLILSADPRLVEVVRLSLAVSLSATLVAAVVGVPVGVALALRSFPGVGLLRAVVNTGMGLPPVVVGLALSVLLWRSGPLGSLQLIYTPTAMVLAQVVVAAPVAAALTHVALAGLDPELAQALRIDGAGEVVVGWELLRAVQGQALVAVAAAFGRAISEVGASLMVGGNILGQTRTLTTAITLETSRGDFATALALGIVLLLLALAVNLTLEWGGRAPQPAG